MFPLSDSAKSARFPLITLALIAINAFVFYLEVTTPDTEAFIFQYALIPASVSFYNPVTLLPFITSMFLHGGIFHIVSNMWFLKIFGDNIEGYFGKIPFLLFYLLTGIVGNVIQYMFMPTSTIPMLGASGAVSGVLGAYYILYPHSKIKSLLLLFFFLTVVEIPAMIYLFYWFFLQVVSGINTFGQIEAGGGIAFWAHVGGFLAGVLFAWLAKKTEQKGYIEGKLVS